MYIFAHLKQINATITIFSNFHLLLRSSAYNQQLNVLFCFWGVYF